mmetsp:Transcript_14102/g.31460  ORF Transcript_14102/g.31460 Transcript_14102/m.31460 type:complete len:85 (+) Transcript_14102:38-292(+)
MCVHLFMRGRVSFHPSHLNLIFSYASASFFPIILLSAIMLADANPRLIVDTPSAPLTPNLRMLKNTVTTNAFNGIPNRFIITER